MLSIGGNLATLQKPENKSREGWYASARNPLTWVVEYQEEPKPLWSDVERAGERRNSDQGENSREVIKAKTDS